MTTPSTQPSAQAMIVAALRMHSVSVAECKKLLTILDMLRPRRRLAIHMNLNDLESALNAYVAEESR